MTDEFLYEADLGASRSLVDMALARLDGAAVIERIWSRDHTLWKPSPEGISNRLGWLDLPTQGPEGLARLTTLAGELRDAGVRKALLLGMGGSSLAPELFRKTFGVGEGWLDLRIADTTDPVAVRALIEAHPPAETVYIPATKSGGTVETLSLLKLFWSLAREALGDEAGRHFVAITDPGSALEEIAKTRGFRDTVLGIPEVGGRFSALSPFGLFPAALLGIDLSRLLDSARDMAARCGPDVPAARNPAARLGAAMAELARAGRDKLTLVVHDDELGDSFGDWVEQLVAESTGKEGLGILPVVGERLMGPADYGPDRFFVCLGRGEPDEETCAVREALLAAGHPMTSIRIDDVYDLGGQMFLWELATAVAGHILQVNPFDQPNVEAAKVAGRKAVAEFRERGELPSEAPDLDDGSLAVWGQPSAETPVEALLEFLERTRPPEYVSIQAYLTPNERTRNALTELRDRIRSALGVAVTLGFGPRFLHSTGQLHKGDAGHGRFLQLTAEAAEDVTIPDGMDSAEGALTFGVLEAAQAMGDREALLAAGRKVLRVHLRGDPVAGIVTLSRAWELSRTSTPPPVY